MFELLAAVVIRRGWLVVLGWLIVTVTLFQIAPPWDKVSKDDDVRFFPAGYPTVEGQELLERGFPGEASSSQIVFITERRKGLLTPDDFAYVDGLIAELNRIRAANPGLGIKKVETYRSPVIGPRFIGTGKDGKSQAVLTIASLKGTYLAKATGTTVEYLTQVLKKLPPAPTGLSIALTGSAVVGHDMNTAGKTSMENTTYATIALVVVILLVVYRSPLLALIPLLTIALSVWASKLAIALLTTVPGLNFQVINITNVFLVVVLFGAGTDYCLFLIARYREELIKGRSRDEALSEAIIQVGGALVASAGTVIVGLGMLWFSTFAKIQYTGPAIALSLAIALVAALTLAPVLLHWLRATVFWPFRQPQHEAGADREIESLEQLPMSGFWMRVADLVVRYPIRILVLCVLVLAPFAMVGARTRPNYSQLADLNPDQDSVVGAQTVQRYFAVGELSPTAVLLHHPKLNFRTEESRSKLGVLSRQIAQIPSVAEVRSISQPLGKPSVSSGERTFLRRFVDNAFAAAVNARYVSLRAKSKDDADHITRIDVVFKSDPFSEGSLIGLESVFNLVKKASEPGQALEGATSVGLIGATALVNDLKKVTTNDERRMYVLGTIGVYAILVLLIKRPGICLYLIATVILGYLASLGLTELVFRALHRGPDPWVGLDWKVGFFLFVILVAVGEDYNIFLMSRVIEEEHKHGVKEGTRLAIAHTGGIISSCGLIMAGTFGSMLTASLTALRELGFALGLGVILDTFLVRPILVPAFVVIMDQYHFSKSKRFRQMRMEPQPAMPLKVDYGSSTKH
ncbi:MMPL family transporter [Singulisphaera sp. PoT]|uniref:MMPL family transporter n=1 Tax=Singulisphaera sp. PoT TaxID=3411797 RepID=UPI003BF6114D